MLEFDTFQPAYRYGGEAEANYPGKTFEQIEGDLRIDWEKSQANAGMKWDRARDAVRDAHERTVRLRGERLKARQSPANRG